MEEHIRHTTQGHLRSQQWNREALGQPSGGLERIRWSRVSGEMGIASSACSLMERREAQRSNEKGKSQGDRVAKDRSESHSFLLGQ